MSVLPLVSVRAVSISPSRTPAAGGLGVTPAAAGEQAVELAARYRRCSPGRPAPLERFEQRFRHLVGWHAASRGRALSDGRWGCIMRDKSVCGNSTAPRSPVLGETCRGRGVLDGRKGNLTPDPSPLSTWERRTRMTSASSAACSRPGKLHLGNYFGAVKQHIELQDEGECFYFIADYHALTTIREPSDAGEPSKSAADLLRQRPRRGPRLPRPGPRPAQGRPSSASPTCPEVTELAWILAHRHQHGPAGTGRLVQGQGRQGHRGRASACSPTRC